MLTNATLLFNTWLTLLLSSLLLTEPVRFIKKLEDTSFSIGQPLKLVCKYIGSQRIQVTWKKDNKLIWASYQYNVLTTDSSCSLEVLYSDRPAAAGKYSCEISNGVGSDVCHAHVSLGKGKSTDLPTASRSSANLLGNYLHFLKWCLITLISLLENNNKNCLFHTGNMFSHPVYLWDGMEGAQCNYFLLWPIICRYMPVMSPN